MIVPQVIHSIEVVLLKEVEENLLLKSFKQIIEEGNWVKQRAPLQVIYCTMESRP